MTISQTVSLFFAKRRMEHHAQDFGTNI